MRKIVVFSLLLSSMALFAANRTVTVFKNGIGFIREHIEVNSKKSVYPLDYPGKPLFGTFFIDGRDLKHYRLTRLAVEEADLMINPGKILGASIGQEISFDTEKGKITGKLVNYAPTGYFTITSGGKDTLYHTGVIKSLSVVKLPALTKKVLKNQLELTFSRPGKKSLDLHYLTRNISWFPTYRVDLLGKKKAMLRLEAMMVNDAEDLKDVDLNFAVGVSNFKYNHLESPITGSLTLAQFINQLGGSRYNTYNRDNFRNDFSNAIMTQQRVSYSPHRSSGSSGYQVAINRNEDLYLFPAKDVTLLKGERARFKLFEQPITLEHIYDADLNNGVENKPHRVWHSLKMKNSTRYPWTTGSAIVVKKGKPISQDRIEYTPPGEDGVLKITISPDINVIHNDKELKRIPRDKKRSGYHFNKHIVEGTITIQNNKVETIKLNIRRKIIGNIDQVAGGKVDPKFRDDNYNNSYGLNGDNDVVWEITLKGKERKTITYQYHHYKR